MQLKKYISRKTDPFTMERDAFQTSWLQGLNYAFPLFSLIGRVLTKVQREKAILNLMTPAWQTQACMLTKVARNEHSKPDSSSKLPRVNKESKKGGSFTVTKSVLTTSGIESFREKLSSEGISGRAPDLISKARRMRTNSNYESAWRSLIVDAVKDKLIPLDVI